MLYIHCGMISVKNGSVGFSHLPAVTDDSDHRHIQFQQVHHIHAALAKGVDLTLCGNLDDFPICVLRGHALCRHSSTFKTGAYMEIWRVCKPLEHADPVHPVGVRRDRILHFDDGHIPARFGQKQGCFTAHQAAAHNCYGLPQCLEIRIGRCGVLCQFHSRQGETNGCRAGGDQQGIRLVF